MDFKVPVSPVVFAQLLGAPDGIEPPGVQRLLGILGLGVVGDELPESTNDCRAVNTAGVILEMKHVPQFETWIRVRHLEARITCILQNVGRIRAAIVIKHAPYGIELQSSLKRTLALSTCESHCTVWARPSPSPRNDSHLLPVQPMRVPQCVQVLGFGLLCFTYHKHNPTWFARRRVTT